MDPELRDAFNQLAADLRGEIRSGNAETRVYVDERVGVAVADMRAYIDDSVRRSAAETRADVDDRIETSAAETRRHFSVVGESLRGDIRAVAEGVALLNQRMDWRDQEQAGSTDAIEGRVLRLEVRVTSLEADRKPRRPRRGR